MDGSLLPYISEQPLPDKERIPSLTQYRQIQSTFWKKGKGSFFFILVGFGLQHWRFYIQNSFKGAEKVSEVWVHSQAKRC